MINQKPRECTAPKTLNDAIELAKQNAVSSILFWIREGLTLDDAAARVKQSSCFGPKAWNEVLATVKEESIR